MSRFLRGLVVASSFLCVVPSCGPSEDETGTSLSRLLDACGEVCQRVQICRGETNEAYCARVCDPQTLQQEGAPGMSGMPCNYDLVARRLNPCTVSTCFNLNGCYNEATMDCRVPPGSTPAGAGGAGGLVFPPLISGAGGAPPVGAGGAPPVVGAGGAPVGSGCEICDPAGQCCVALNTMAGQSTAGCEAINRNACETSPDKVQMIQGCVSLASSCVR
jgi:hypothetical protein